MNTKVEYTAAQMRCIEEHRESMWQSMDNWWAESVIEEFTAALAAFGIDICTTARKVTYRNGEEKTIYDPTINWDVSCCQGSGASFETERFSISDFMDCGARVMHPPEQPFGPLPRGETRWDHDRDYLATDEGPVAKLLREHLEWCDSLFSTYRLHGRAWLALTNASIRCTLGRSHYSHSGSMSVDEIEGVDPDPDPDDIPEAMLVIYQTIADTCDEWQAFLRQLADALHDNLETEWEYQTSDECVWEMIQSNDLFDPAEYADDDDDDDDNEVTLAQAA